MNSDHLFSLSENIIKISLEEKKRIEVDRHLSLLLKKCEKLVFGFVAIITW